MKGACLSIELAYMDDFLWIISNVLFLLANSVEPDQTSHCDV